MVDTTMFKSWVFLQTLLCTTFPQFFSLTFTALKISTINILILHCLYIIKPLLNSFCYLYSKRVSSTNVFSLWELYQAQFQNSGTKAVSEKWDQKVTTDYSKAKFSSLKETHVRHLEFIMPKPDLFGDGQYAEGIPV